jgi:hypothetical protein
LKDIGIDFLAELFAGIGCTAAQRLNLLRSLQLEANGLLDLLLSNWASKGIVGLLSLLLLWLLFGLLLTLFLKEANEASKDTLLGLGLLLHNLLLDLVLDILGLLLDLVLDIIFSRVIFN